MNQPLQEQLDELALAISAQLWSKTRTWGGAGILIRKKHPEFKGDDHPYVVVTKYAGELSWLFTRLRDIASQFEDFYFAKYSFFAELAQAASTVSFEESIDILLIYLIPLLVLLCTPRRDEGLWLQQESYFVNFA